MLCLKTLIMFVAMMTGGAIFASTPEIVVYSVGGNDSSVSYVSQSKCSPDSALGHWLQGIQEDWEEDCNLQSRKTDVAARSLSGALEIGGLNIVDTGVFSYSPLAFPGAVLSCRKAVLSTIIALE